MKKFPELKTKRLRLRKLDPTDISLIVKYANNKTISENILNIKLPYEVEDAVFWLNFSLQGYKNNERYVFAITLKESPEFIGVIALHINQEHDTAQLAYWLGEPFWNKGLATEAAREVLMFGFDSLKLNKIYATHFAENEASGKILIHMGMVREAEFKDQYKVNNTYKTVFQYRLTRQEYKTFKEADVK